MKVSSNETLRIATGRLTNRLFASIKPGETVSARIASITGPRQAVLSFRGNRVNAEFLKGVPGSREVLLQLESREGGIFRFRIITDPGREGVARSLDSWLMVSPEKLDASLLARIHSRLSEGGVTFIELYRLIVLGRDKGKDNRLQNVLNRLLDMGMDTTTLRSILPYLSPGPTIAGFFYPFMKKAGIQWEGPFDFAEPLDEEEEVGRFVERARESLKKEPGLLEDLLDALMDKEDGELPFLKDGKVVTCPMIMGEKSVYLQVPFQYLGTVDILLRERDDLLDVRLYAEKEEARDILETEKEELVDELATLGFQVSVITGTGQNVVDTIGFLLTNTARNIHFDRKA
jgi:hypothetical protein